MDNLSYWNKFSQSGLIKDYLVYSSVEKEEQSCWCKEKDFNANFNNGNNIEGNNCK